MQKLRETYLVLFIFVQNLQGFHGPDHRLHGSEDVLVHQLGEAFFVLFRVAWAMNYTHLLNERAFSTLPSAYRMQERELGAITSKACYRRKQANINYIIPLSSYYYTQVHATSNHFFSHFPEY